MERDILTNNGMEIHLVRYFDYQDKKYLIFTSDGEGEKDDQGHIFVHIAEIDGLTAKSVEGETYETVKSIIKDIVTKNKNNIPLAITDLNYNDLNGLNIVSDRQLGLLSNYVEILKQNQPDFPEETSDFNSDNFGMNAFSMESPTNFSEEPQVEDTQKFGEENPFNQFTMGQQPMPKPSEEASVDYEKMYLEQLELVNKLNSEIEIYKNKLETIENIINN